VATSDSQYAFKIGIALRLTGQLLRQNWHKLIWLYVVFLLVPGVVLGELGDTAGEPLYGFFNSNEGLIESGLGMIFIYAYQIPTALFFAFALSALLNRAQKPWRGGVSAFLTILLLQLVPFAVSILSQKVMSMMPTMVLIYAVQVTFMLLSVVISVFTYVAPAVATTKWNPAITIGRSLTLVWPHWFRVLLFVLLTIIVVVLAGMAEEWLLSTYQTADGTAMDWLTTVLQELIRSGYMILSVALITAVFLGLQRAQDGPTATETASVFD
jgi:hypothetical protein